MGKRVDITGQRFGRLTVLRFAGRDRRGEAEWFCRCDCGNEKKFLSSNLLNGKSQSCGCLRRELTTAKNTKHGQRYTRLYRIWLGMKTRCYTPTSTDYPYYGERGITVCDDWANDYEMFQRWALSNGYEDGLTIDRKDVNGNYEPSNCRWVTMKEQAANKRVSKCPAISKEAKP